MSLSGEASVLEWNVWIVMLLCREVSDLSLNKLHTKVQMVDISGFINLSLDSYVQLNYPLKCERREQNHPQKSKSE